MKLMPARAPLDAVQAAAARKKAAAGKGRKGKKGYDSESEEDEDSEDDFDDEDFEAAAPKPKPAAAAARKPPAAQKPAATGAAAAPKPAATSKPVEPAAPVPPPAAAAAPPLAKPEESEPLSLAARLAGRFQKLAVAGAPQVVAASKEPPAISLDDDDITSPAPPVAAVKAKARAAPAAKATVSTKVVLLQGPHPKVSSSARIRQGKPPAPQAANKRKPKGKKVEWSHCCGTLSCVQTENPIFALCACRS